MNGFQKAFIGLGVIALLLLGLFPPQITFDGSVAFLPITDGNPVDWFKLVIWVFVVVMVSGLGVFTNKKDSF